MSNPKDAVRKVLDQVKADPNPDHRAKAAVDYASVAEKNAEAAYTKGDTQGVEAELAVAAVVAVEDFEAEGFLGLEVVGEGADGDVGGLGDVADAGVGIAALVHDI